MDDTNVIWPHGPEELDRFRSRIETKLEVNFRGRLGADPGDDKEIRMLNRVVAMADEGLEYEIDQRHAEVIVKQLGLGKNVKRVKTLGLKTGKAEGEEARKRRVRGVQSY